MSSVYRIPCCEAVYVAICVIANDYGAGEDRVRRLKSAGYNPERIQQCVNDLIALNEKYREE